MNLRLPVTKPLYWVNGSLPGDETLARKRTLNDPATFEVTSPFGDRNGVFHGGLDIGNGHEGDPVVAAASGKVIAAGWLSTPWSDGYGGNMVVLEHLPGVVTLYAHLQSVAVLSGSAVLSGQRVGILGRSSRVSLPAHLHFGLQAVARMVPATVATHRTTNGIGLDVDPWPFLLGTAHLGDDMRLPTGFAQGPANRVVTVQHGNLPTLVRSEPYSSDPAPAQTIVGRSKQRFELQITGHVQTPIGLWYGGAMFVGGNSIERYGSGENGWQMGWVHSALCSPPVSIEASGITEEEAARRETDAALNGALAVAAAAVDAAKRFGG